MSSLARRIEIRGMKAMGYRRLKRWKVKQSDGSIRLVSVARGGIIIDPEGKPVGRRWPRRAGA